MANPHLDPAHLAALADAVARAREERLPDLARKPSSLAARLERGYDPSMVRRIEPVGHVARGFEEADAWDREQLLRMSLDERLTIVEALRRRAYGADAPDVRESQRGS